MCSSDPRPAGNLRSLHDGFSLVEVLLAAVLTLMLLAFSLPVWFGLQSVGVGEIDHGIAREQVGVAETRLERDLRFASASDCLGAASNAVLQATGTQFVMLTGSGGATPEIVEWELSHGSLMRRRGPWTGSVPWDFPHALYVDHKTMMEGINGSFSYSGAGFEEVASVEQARLGLVRTVRLIGRVVGAGGAFRPLGVAFEARVFG